MFSSGLAITGLTCLAVAMVYAMLTLLAVVAWKIHTLVTRAATTGQLPPVTILKPLCGAEPGLYAQLRSFCVQDYPRFQIVFGTCDASDSALEAVRQLQAEFPRLSIDTVTDPLQHGSNRKTSNLINMLAYAQHDLLTMADSDTSVKPDYLRTVVAPLLNEGVGLVTSIYRSSPTSPLWSRLGAMYVNEWYMPSVLLTWLFGYRGYASGQTLCLRRSTLEAVGGFPVLADQLADDYVLGELIRGLGLRIVLSPAEVTVVHHEPDFERLEQHEMRWMRTLRVLRPRSFCLLFLSFSLPLSLVGLQACVAASAVSVTAWTLFGVTLLARLGVHFAHRPRSQARMSSDLWLVAVRDLLLCWVWLRGFSSSRIVWRDYEFQVSVDGIMQDGVIQPEP